MMNNNYLVRNIAAEMYLKNSEHMQRLESFGRKLAEETLKQKRAFIKLIMEQFGQFSIFELKPKQIEMFLINDCKHGNSWKNSYLDTFASIYEETIWMDKQCPKPIFHRFIRHSKKADIFKVDELKEIFASNCWRSYDELLLFKVIFFCGLRISEGRALKPSQFFWDKKVMIVNGFCKKNGERTNYNKKGSDENPKFRIVIMPDELILQLQKYIQMNKIKDDDFIFKFNNKPYRRELLERDFKNVISKSNILIGDRKLVPHSLRFTYVSLMRRNVRIEDIKNFVGHTSVSMTEYYSRFDIDNIICSISGESFSAVNNLLKMK